MIAIAVGKIRDALRLMDEYVSYTFFSVKKYRRIDAADDCYSAYCFLKAGIASDGLKSGALQR